MSTLPPSPPSGRERLRQAWRGSRVPAFLAAWGAELQAALPPRWRGWVVSAAVWHGLRRDRHEWVLYRMGQAQPLARWRADDPATAQQAALQAALQAVDREDRRLALLLDPHDVLRRVVSLPLAARHHLAQVMAFEMDRQTPFTVDQVHYAVRELAPAEAGPAGHLQAELLATPRRVLDPLLAQLGASGIVIDAVDLAEGEHRLGVNLLPPARRPRHAHPRRRLNALLAAACVLLALLALGQYRHNRQQLLDRMQARVESMRADAQEVMALRQQLADNAGAAGFLVARKQRSTTMLALLADLTRRLPDTAWLERLSIDASGQLGLQGQSQRAAGLLDALKDSPLITGAAFQGAIQPDATTGKERFYLVAQLRNAPASTAPAASGSAP
ncbi:PilN domain-containing protein [Rhodanobacter caeni]|uniref:PilN domain-containing protein n=1 Tax=Rhodanobacter caeni TaxID=657654 RepID=A0ABP3E8U6_9GAMM